MVSPPALGRACVARDPGFLEWPHDLRVLSIDGGGYLGLASASFLQSLEGRLGARCADRFDLFCGTSTGAIIALALAHGLSAGDVVALYEAMGPAVFRPVRFGAAGRYAKQLTGALHDNGPLRDALRDAFGDITLNDLRERGRRVLVTAFSVTAGTPRIFKTDHAPALRGHGGYLVRDVALASSAAPTYLPLVDLVDPITKVSERFCDGAMVSNSPALMGYAEAVSHLGARPEDVSVLSVGTPRVDLAEPASARTLFLRGTSRGLVGWGLGAKVITLALDGGSLGSHHTLRLIAGAAGARYVRVTLAQPAGTGLDVATPEATETLRHIGALRAQDAATLADARPFFADGDGRP